MNRIDKIRQKWTDEMLVSLPGVPPEVWPEDVFQAACNADPTPQKKMVSWLLDSWSRRGFLWEDIRAGKSSVVADTLFEFEAKKKHLPAPERSLMQYDTPGDIWNAIQPFQENLDIGSNQKKRLAARKAKLETITHEMIGGGVVHIPLTNAASKFHGKGTRWCTSAEQNNMFEHYSNEGPLYILETPTQEKFQAHFTTSDQLYARETLGGEDPTPKKENPLYYFDMPASFMDAADNKVTHEKLDESWPFIAGMADIITQDIIEQINDPQVSWQFVKNHIWESFRDIADQAEEDKNNQQEVIVGNKPGTTSNPIDISGILSDTSILPQRKIREIIKSGWTPEKNYDVVQELSKEFIENAFKEWDIIEPGHRLLDQDIVDTLYENAVMIFMGELDIHFMNTREMDILSSIVEREFKDKPILEGYGSFSEAMRYQTFSVAAFAMPNRVVAKFNEHEKMLYALSCLDTGNVIGNMNDIRHSLHLNRHVKRFGYTGKLEKVILSSIVENPTEKTLDTIETMTPDNFKDVLDICTQEAIRDRKHKQGVMNDIFDACHALQEEIGGLPIDSLRNKRILKLWNDKSIQKYYSTDVKDIIGTSRHAPSQNSLTTSEIQNENERLSEIQEVLKKAYSDIPGKKALKRELRG